jgi:hypothetical protein
MGYPHLTPGRRLFLFLMEGDGSRTLTEISRRNADGRLLARGRKELGDLIAEEEGRDARTQRPVTRIIITTRGWAAAAELRPGWVPKRRTLDALKAELRDRQVEKDPWACQIRKDGEDAALLAKLRYGGWIRRPRKRWVDKMKAKTRAEGKIGEYRVYEPPADYVEARDRLPNPYNEPEPKRKFKPRGRPFQAQGSTQLAPAQTSALPPPATPAQPRPESFAAELARIQGSQLAGFATQHRGFDNSPQSEPRAATGESRSEVVSRARCSGHYFDNAFHTIDNRIVSWQEWAAWAPK